ncbi:zinc finger protein 777-like [Hyla sarda]|uniref:zinc finger protein 777-like n=1 Tax=Hyla sarda TaxID=327740 RepID=UPI0024C2F45B|nr:zinc finger protein 777-like [Hyla sarda]
MTASGDHEQAAPVFEDTTLSFSDEEWLELATWQRELYRTVMRDTMDLVTSLGYMFLKRGESEQRDSAETEETALEEIIHIPETVLEDLIYIPETAVTLEKAPSSGELFSPYPVTDEQPPTTGAQKRLEEKSDPPVRETTFIHEVKPENKDGSPIAGPRTWALIRTLEDASSPCVGFEQVLSGFSVDLFNGCNQEGTQDHLDNTEFLTVIKVEEINVTIGSEIMSLHSDRWEGHPEYPNKEEHWDLQGGAVLPLASTDPHNNYYLPWTDNQRALSPGTLQWTEQTPLTNGQCVEEGGTWLTVTGQQRSPLESLYTENFYKCSMCGRSFLQGPNYHESLQLEKGAFSCPTCSSYLSDQHHLPPFLRNGQPDINSTHQPSQDKPNVTCPKCKRSFSQVSGLHRHMKSHSRNKTTVKVTAPPQRKVNDGPILQDTETRSTTQSSRQAYSKLHRHLQLSTAFLQQLITSTGGFQYD